MVAEWWPPKIDSPLLQLSVHASNDHASKVFYRQVKAYGITELLRHCRGAGNRCLY